MWFRTRLSTTLVDPRLRRRRPRRPLAEQVRAPCGTWLDDPRRARRPRSQSADPPHLENWPEVSPFFHSRRRDRLHKWASRSGPGGQRLALTYASISRRRCGLLAVHWHATPLVEGDAAGPKGVALMRSVLPHGTPPAPAALRRRRCSPSAEMEIVREPPGGAVVKPGPIIVPRRQPRRTRDADGLDTAGRSRSSRHRCHLAVLL